jgi:hypothetical protein
MQPIMMSAYSAIIDTTATKIRYSIVASLNGFRNATMVFALHVPWLLLCKNCSAWRRQSGTGGHRAAMKPLRIRALHLSPERAPQRLSRLAEVGETLFVVLHIITDWVVMADDHAPL